MLSDEYARLTRSLGMHQRWSRHVQQYWHILPTKVPGRHKPAPLCWSVSAHLLLQACCLCCCQQLLLLRLSRPAGRLLKLALSGSKSLTAGRQAWRQTHISTAHTSKCTDVSRGFPLYESHLQVFTLPGSSCTPLKQYTNAGLACFMQLACPAPALSYACD